MFTVIFHLSQRPIQFKLTIQIIDGDTGESWKLRSPGRPVMADNQVRHLRMNLQPPQPTPTGIHRTAAAVLTGAAAVSAGQEKDSDRVLRVRTVSGMDRTGHRICQNTSIC